MRLYTRRLVALANLRREMGEEGLRNNGRRIKAFFNLNLAPVHMYARGIKLWMLAEADGLRLKLKKLLRLTPKPATPPVSDPQPT
jgi:hypothetical protein